MSTWKQFSIGSIFEGSAQDFISWGFYRRSSIDQNVSQLMAGNMLQRPGAAHKFVRKSEKHLKLLAHKSNSTRMNHAWSLFPEHCHRACGFSFVCFSEISDEIPHVFFHLIFRRHVASFTNSRERNKTEFSRFKVAFVFFALSTSLSCRRRKSKNSLI